MEIHFKCTSQKQWDYYKPYIDHYETDSFSSHPFVFDKTDDEYPPVFLEVAVSGSEEVTEERFADYMKRAGKRWPEPYCEAREFGEKVHEEVLGGEAMYEATLTGFIEFEVIDSATNSVAMKSIIALSSAKRVLWNKLSLADTIALETVSGYGLFAANYEDFCKAFDHMVSMHRSGALGELSTIEHYLCEYVSQEFVGYFAAPKRTVVDGREIWNREKSFQ